MADDAQDRWPISDAVWALVVVANNEQEARSIAQQRGWREIEKGDVWLDPNLTTCEEVVEAGVVLQKIF